MAEPVKVSHQETPEDYKARIGDLFTKERVPGARKLIEEALQKFPDDPGLLAWRKALAPPQAWIGGPRDKDRTPEFRWLDDHGPQYRGEWVAVLGDRLLGHSPDYGELNAYLDELPAEEFPPLVVYIQDR